MATIGGITCDFVSGVFRTEAARVEAWQSPGQKGYGLQITGLGDSVFRVIVVKIGNLTASDPDNVRDWSVSVLALKGQFITVVTDQGETFNNCSILEIELPEFSPRVYPGEASKTYRAEIKLSGVVRHDYS